jgi:preprotein translocase subunit SecA
MNKVGRPVLVGTTSVEQSESLSVQLREAGISHEVYLLIALTLSIPAFSILECCS